MIIILFFIGLLAGFINVVAGGGSALTLPMLILVGGLDGATANGTNRLAILMQNIFAVWGFEQNKLNSFRQSLLFATATLPGAILGAMVAIRFEAWFNTILGFVILFVIVSMLIPKPVRLTERVDSSKMRRFVLYLALFGVGFYGGFIQAGVGFILMATLFYLAGFNLLKVNVHKVFIVLIYTVPAFLVFVINGKVDWLLGFSLAAGNGLGGWLAAHASVRKGEKFIRLVLVVVLIAMAVKLIFFGK